MSLTEGIYSFAKTMKLIKNKRGGGHFQQKREKENEKQAKPHISCKHTDLLSDAVAWTWGPKYQMQTKKRVSSNSRSFGEKLMPAAFLTHTPMFLFCISIRHALHNRDVALCQARHDFLSFQLESIFTSGIPGCFVTILILT